MRSPKSDLPQGTLDMLILKVVALGPIHGYAIAQRIEQISREVLQVQQGSLYPALHRLENRGWLKAEWRDTETGREAKFYSLTREGRKRLEAESSNWDRLSEAIRLIILTDVVMSFDNILAIAAVAEGNYLLVAFGISLSLPLVIWGSGLLARWMNRRAWIIWLGGGVVGYAAGEMMLKDAVFQAWLGREIADALRNVFPVVLGTTVAAAGWRRSGTRRS